MPDLHDGALTTVQPAGELAARMHLILNRLTGTGFPEYTAEFILADVKLDPAYPRLYDSFSGDISGRYIEALALCPTADAARLADLVRELIQHQKPDGRFGDAGISFTAAEIGKPHMALLWGNGRLLAGLVTYHAAYPSEPVLAAAVRLGDFLLQVREDCAAPGVADRLEGLGAHGLICFTQLIEGLVLLGQATGDTRYLDAAREIAPSLPPRGIQHTHGYLSTLRGVVLLYAATGDAALLADAESKFQELLRSPDYVVYGGVLEFFGAETHGISQDDLAKLHALDNKPPQDEGCSEADFVRLGLQLWRATGNTEYLERAERCLLNHFYFNQFHSGDFGHKVLSHRGFRPSDNPGKAWWCCNMHGLRTFPDVADAIVTREGASVQVNLFLDCDRSDGYLDFSIRQADDWDGVVLTILADSEGEIPLSVRRPTWATELRVRVNGEAANVSVDASSHAVTRRWHRGDEVRVELTYREYVQLRSGEQVDLSKLGPEPVEAALFCGPWLLGVHEAEEPAFLERPWTWGAPNENIVDLPTTLRESRVLAPTDGAIPGPRVACRLAYRHGGWPGRAEVTLRPIACQTACAHQQVLAVWITFQRS
ncbi:MAG: beta-L-arabinofuranosidase domain-containing protein [Actinomycetota bacterium]